jgi:quinol monooxygenase YgiN
MIVVVGSFRLPPEGLDAGRGAMARVVNASRAEPGCLAYAYAEDMQERGLVRVNESWESRAALSAHFETPHMKQWRRERSDLGMSERRVIAYEVSGEEAL